MIVAIAGCAADPVSGPLPGVYPLVRAEEMPRDPGDDDVQQSEGEAGDAREVHRAAAVAAWNDDAHVAERRAVFRAKRDRLAAFFREHGLAVQDSGATLYLWVKVPAGYTSAGYASRLLDEAIVVSPGTAFGAGEGYVRVALVPTLEECREAIAAWREVRT